MCTFLRHIRSQASIHLIRQINVLTAVVNSMIPLVRKRPHFLARVSKSYVQWWKTRPQNMTLIQKKSADKVVKVAFVTLIRYMDVQRTLQTRSNIMLHQSR